MDVSKLLKDLRSRLKLGQVELAEALGVSFATVNRWEKGHFKPTPVALRAIKQFCIENGIDYQQYEESEIASKEIDLILYASHSSEIAVEDELFLDRREEAMQSAGERGSLYEARLTLSDARVVTMTSAADFLFFNAFRKKMLTKEEAPQRFERYQRLTETADIVVTYGITKDLSHLLTRFYRGEITDRALGACLSLYTAGQGYFLISDRAKGALTVKKKFVKKNPASEDSGLDAVLRQYRREGYYFDEILSGEQEE
ncbi:MAG: helix-turn-helix transcriptional regulator, partial [Clostridia bacterium]|nr:helix-turn-helix transcriptional regulator [Clostridia bacterium]